MGNRVDVLHRGIASSLRGDADANMQAFADALSNADFKVEITKTEPFSEIKEPKKSALPSLRGTKQGTVCKRFSGAHFPAGYRVSIKELDYYAQGWEIYSDNKTVCWLTQKAQQWGITNADIAPLSDGAYVGDQTMRRMCKAVLQQNAIER